MANEETGADPLDDIPDVMEDYQSEVDERRALQSAVTKLVEVVSVLQQTIEGEYISRREVTDMFTSKQQSIKARKWFAALILASLLAGFLTTISTVSLCFLTPQGDQVACHILPGYAQAQERSKKLNGIFVEMQRKTQVNGDRIIELEKKVK